MPRRVWTLTPSGIAVPVPRRKPWTTVPGIVGRPNLTPSVGAGFDIFLVASGLNFVDRLGNGATAVPNGTLVPGHSSFGSGVSGNANNANYFATTGLPVLADGNAYSYLAIACITGSLASLQHFINGDETNRAFQFRMNSGKVEFIGLNTASAGSTAVGATVVAGQPFCAVSRFTSAGVASVWVNGVKGTDGSATGGTIKGQPANSVTLLTRLSGITPLTGHLTLVVRWPRALTDAEALELSRNPWLLFEPRRIILPAAAAGGGITGTSAETVDGIRSVGTGAAAVGGTGAETVAPIQSAGAAGVSVAGTGSNRVAAVRSAGTGGASVGGTGSSQIAPVTSAGVGGPAIAGSGSNQLAAVTTTGSGTAISGVSGTGAEQIAPIASAGSGGTVVSGSGAERVAPAVSTGSGGVAVAGTGGNQVAAIAGSGLGSSVVAGVGSEIIAQVRSSGAGTVTTPGGGVTGSGASLAIVSQSFGLGAVTDGGPILTTTRELIMRQVAAQLVGVTGIGTRVYRSRQDAFSRGEAPSLLVTPESEDYADDIVNKTEKTLRITVGVYQRGDIPDGLADAIVEQSHVRLMADPQLTGLAIDTSEDGTNWDFDAADAEACIVNMRFKVWYRHDRADLAA